MTIIKTEDFRILVPTEKEYLCSIEDKERYDNEMAEEEKKPIEYRKEVTPIYKFKEALIPPRIHIQSYEKNFMEID